MGWCGGSDYVGCGLGRNVGGGMELRSRQPGACWADGIERGKKPSTLAGLSASLSTTNPLFSPPHSKYMFSPLWRGVKKLRVHDWGYWKSKRTWFSSWRVQKGGDDRVCKETINEMKSKFMFKLMNCIVLRYTEHTGKAVHTAIYFLPEQNRNLLPASSLSVQFAQINHR